MLDWRQSLGAVLYASLGASLGALAGRPFLIRGVAEGPGSSALWPFLWWACVCAAAAGAWAAYDRLSRGHRSAALPWIGIAAAMGAVASAIGMLGLAATAALAGVPGASAAGFVRPAETGALLLVPRALQGLLLGLGVAVAASPTGGLRGRPALGALGGACGGLFGAVVFEALVGGASPIGSTSASPAKVALAHGMGATILMALIGLAASLAVDLGKRGAVRVLAGPHQGATFPIFSGANGLGQSLGCTIALTREADLMPFHAILRHGPEGLWLEAAHAGIHVNGHPETSAQLRSGDRLRVGSSLADVWVTASTDAATASVDASGWAPARPGACPYCGATVQPGTGACLCTHRGGADGGEGPAAAVTPEAPPGEPPLAAPAWPQPHREPRLGLARRVGQRAFIHPLDAPITTIGRGDACDIRLDEARVSRDHASIERSADGYLVVDSDSANGTFVNGDRVSRAALSVGDRLHIGPVRLLVVDMYEVERRSQV